MNRWIERLLGRGAARPATTSRAGTFHTVSHPDGEWTDSVGNAFDVIALPNGTPFYMMEVYRYLRDAIPDISDAVWTWKRLCQTGYDVEILEPSSEYAETRATAVCSGAQSGDGQFAVSIPARRSRRRT